MTRKQSIATILGTAAVAVTGSVYMLNGNKTPDVIQHNYLADNQGYYSLKPKPGDTLWLKGNYNGFYFGNVSGTKDSPIVIMGYEAYVHDGFAFENCNWFQLHGVHINSHNANPTNDAVNIYGFSNHFWLHKIHIDSAQYFVTFKTEVELYSKDTSYWHIMQDDILIDSSVFNYAKQDGFYLGSTNTKGDRLVTYNGKSFYHAPDSVSNCKMLADTIQNVQRTGVQISNATGTNYIKYCTFYNCGFEYALSNWEGSLHQGVGGAFGGNDYGNFEFAYNHIKLTFLNSFSSSAGGTVLVHDNVADSADWCIVPITNKLFPNPQQNAAFIISPPKNTLLKTWNNSIGYSNNNTKMVVYGYSDYFVNGSCISDQFSNQTGYNFLSDCGVTKTTCDTTYKSITVPYDSTLTIKDSSYNDKYNTKTTHVVRTVSYHKTKTQQVINTIKCN